MILYDAVLMSMLLKCAVAGVWIQRQAHCHDRKALGDNQRAALCFYSALCHATLFRRYGVAITWDPVDYAKPVDLDLQALIVDKRGYIETWQSAGRHW